MSGIRIRRMLLTAFPRQSVRELALPNADCPRDFDRVFGSRYIVQYGVSIVSVSTSTFEVLDVCLIPTEIRPAENKWTGDFTRYHNEITADHLVLVHADWDIAQKPRDIHRISSKAR